MCTKVLLIADFDVFGGTRRYFYQLNTFCEKQGYSVYFALEKKTANKTRFSPEKGKLLFLPEQRYFYHFIFFKRFISFFQFFWRQLTNLIYLWRIIKRKDIDLVVISSGYGDRYLSILALNIPCLYISHSIPQKSSNDKFFRLFLRITMDPRKRIIAVSENMREMIQKYWGSEVTKKYIIRLYNCSEQNDNSKSNIYHFGTRKTILTLGHVIWYKNPEFWIKVIECFNTHSQFKDYSWIWAGDGDLLENCRKTITDKKITNASFIGYSANVQELYDKALIYFQPSILESFGLSVLDAMQRGIPCVVTRVGGLPELVIDGETGFIIEDGDMKGAVEKISWLLSHPEESEKMGNAGYVRYKHLFTEEKWIENMERIHKEILSEIPNNSK